jgi:4-azaleucine resistance transporter AzlC
MAHRVGELHVLNRRLVRAGFVDLVPLSIFVTLFGAAFGLAAAQDGLGTGVIIGMSVFVFAGAAQFAALELWGAQVPVLTLAVTVFAINARHLLMGASLYPWLRQLPPRARYGVMMTASDANWAMSLEAIRNGKPGLGILLGGGLALWLFWVAGTCLGIYFGEALRNPKELGLDMVMGCFLLAMVVGGKKDIRILAIWAVAGCAALLARWLLPENTHVVVGAVAGGLAGLIWNKDDH